MAAANWQDVNRQVLDSLNLESVYRSMGLDITGGPSPSGWAPCRVFGSQEGNPSAGVNLTGDHPEKGRYKEFTGECRNLSFYEFCSLADPGRFVDWKAARDHYRKECGIKSPASNAKKPASERLAFRNYNDALVRSWASTKPPIAEWAVRIAGGRLAGYPLTSEKYTCVVLPVFGAHGVNDDPCGWVAYNKSGRPLPVSRGKGRPVDWVKIKTIEGSQAGWMNKFALANLERAEIVWKVEGPADMLALVSGIPKDDLFRHVVLTNSAGTLNILPDDHLDLLTGKTVYVVHDCDKDGRAGGEKWTEAIARVAAEVRHVLLPYEVAEKHGRDLRDWLNEGHDYSELLAMAAATVPAPKPSAADSDKPGADADPLTVEKLICYALRLDVLGELPDQKIKVFSEEYGKAVTVDNVNRLTRASLIQICGPPARDSVFEGTGEPSPNQFHVATVREAIAMLAGRESAGEGVELGQGVWRGKDGDREKLVLVGPGEAVVVNGDVERICKPRVAGLKVNLDASKDESWFELSRFREYLKLAENLDWRGKQVDTACGIFDQWFWRNTTGVAPELMAGLVMCTWVQSVWSWRPLVSICGPSDCGKSSLFEVLETMFGPLALLSSKSTEAGIRQAVANHSKVILCDEFESDSHRKKILEFFRTSSKGSKTLRGTVSQSSKGFGLRHICWVTAIEIGLSRAPDRNRFINLELTSPPDDRRGKLTLPPLPEIADLGQRLLAIAVKHALPAAKVADKLKGNSFQGIHGRVVESFAVPVAMLATSCGLDAEGAVAFMERVFGELEQDPAQGTKDEVSLLGAILESTVQLGHGDEATVGQILSHPSSYSGGLDAIERAGVKLKLDGRYATAPPKIGVFIAHQAVLRYLLRGTQWSEQSIDQLLVRLPGARKRQNECGGHVPWGVMLPWDYVSQRFLGGADDSGPSEF